MKKILIMGLPGVGKTTLAAKLVPLILPHCVHFNADEVRAAVHRDLGFAPEDRVEHARRLGWWGSAVTKSGAYVVADFVCPTPETRRAFSPDFVIWVNTLKKGRYEDTNKLFVIPAIDELGAVPIVEFDSHAEINDFATMRSLVQTISGWDPKAPTALLIGRYQPFHAGHLALVREALKRVGQVYIAVRETGNTSSKDPFEFLEVHRRIREVLQGCDWCKNVIVGRVPNLTKIYYGRDVGYEIEYLELAPELQAISATAEREKLREAGKL